MPFPLIPAALAGAGLLSSFFGGPGKEQKQLAQETTREGLEASREFRGTSQDLMGAAMPAFEQATDYWNAIMQGGTAARQAVGPFIEQLSELYGGQRKSMETFLPRGGERNLALAGLDIQQTGDVARLFAGLQPQAAQQLAQLFGLGAGAAGQFAGAAAGALGPATAGASNLLADAFRRQQALSQNLLLSGLSIGGMLAGGKQAGGGGSPGLNLGGGFGGQGT